MAKVNITQEAVNAISKARELRKKASAIKKQLDKALNEAANLKEQYDSLMISFKEASEYVTKELYREDSNNSE